MKSIINISFAVIFYKKVWYNDFRKVTFSKDARSEGEEEVNSMKTYSYKSVSDWFLSKESMTHKKLQKLTYYFEAWGNALFDKNLINDTVFQAWIHGPVSPELYNDYRDYGWNYIPQVENNDEKFESNALDLLNSVWVTYGDKSANELESLTHLEKPWKEARTGLDPDESSKNEISKDVMREYYSSIYIGD